MVMTLLDILQVSMTTERFPSVDLVTKFKLTYFQTFQMTNLTTVHKRVAM